MFVPIHARCCSLRTKQTPESTEGWRKLIVAVLPRGEDEASGMSGSALGTGWWKIPIWGQVDLMAICSDLMGFYSESMGY
jgi:hypothetical protein